MAKVVDGLVYSDTAFLLSTQLLRLLWQPCTTACFSRVWLLGMRLHAGLTSRPCVQQHARAAVTAAYHSTNVVHSHWGSWPCPRPRSTISAIDGVYPSQLQRFTVAACANKRNKSTPLSKIEWNTAVESIPGIGEKAKLTLATKSIYEVGDLVTWYYHELKTGKDILGELQVRTACCGPAREPTLGHVG